MGWECVPAETGCLTPAPPQLIAPKIMQTSLPFLQGPPLFAVHLRAPCGMRKDRAACLAPPGKYTPQSFCKLRINRIGVRRVATCCYLWRLLAFLLP